MNEIPTRRISEIFDGRNAFLLRIVPGGNRQMDGKDGAHLEYAHRNDYYIFLLIKGGSGKGMVDFKEYEFTPGTIHCIMPGQVHSPTGEVDMDCWFLAVDGILVKNEYRDIFERATLSGRAPNPEKGETEELEAMLRIIDKRFSRNDESSGRSVLTELISSFIGMVADIYRRQAPASLNTRAVELTVRFKSLVSENYRTVKQPSGYARMMNLSLVYLNEVEKNTTGRSVSAYIRDEAVLQAKRLLYYTNMTVKDISLTVGYEDWAYFSRLFTKSAGCPPSQFRRENRDSSNINSR